jgi:2,3-bisphosphoglycerate-independent phosphoglycerate mutase
MASKNKKRLIVVSKHGRYRFQRGLVTASFLQRNLNIEDAMRLSAALKSGLSGQDEVSTQELRALIDELAPEEKAGEFATPYDANQPMLNTRRGLVPFSKGVLLRALSTAGLSIEQAFGFSQEIDRWLRKRGGPVLEERQLNDRLTKELRKKFGDSTARRFRMTEWIFKSPKPVVLLLGGATGTGKSTLAMELAARLRIRMVTSTDMIRETLRTILSPQVVPGLHNHSFGAMGSQGGLLSNPRERALVGFHQQAAQVGVGVRAVIRRAIRESSNIIIEGTHLVPPLEQYLPPGAEVHFAGIMLSVHSKKAHRRRFPERSKRSPLREPSDYLDAFQAVRWIHDDLIELADEHDTVVVSNMDLNQTMIQTVNYFSEALPIESSHESRARGKSKRKTPFPKTLFLILDGLPDEPNPALANKTPLAAAHTPVLDTLAAAGGQGLVNTKPISGETPNTDEGLVALLRPQARGMSIGRGLFEALGQGIPLPSGAVLFRGNLATVQNDGMLVDRRAGRIREGVASLLAELTDIPLVNGVTGHIYPGHEHRVIVMLQGVSLSAAVSDTDPGGSARIHRFQSAVASDETDAAKRTAKALNELLAIASRHLSDHPLNLSRQSRGLYVANCIITRGAASVNELPKLDPMQEQVAVISACSTALGVARAIGYAPVTSADMTGNLDTNIPAKFEMAEGLFQTHDMVAIHFKGTDVAAHDKLPLEKRDYIERVDRALGVFLEDKEGLRVVVAADHGTSCRTGNHLSDPVPLLFSTWEGHTGESEDFDEESATGGVLGLLQADDLFQLITQPG